MRGHLVEQIKIIHFGGGQVKWGLLCEIQLWGISSNRMKPFKFMVFSRVAIVSSWLKVLLLQNARLFYIKSREEPGIQRITIYMCRSGKCDIIHYADQLWGWSSFKFTWFSAVHIQRVWWHLDHITTWDSLNDFSDVDYLRSPSLQDPNYNDLDSKASVQIIIFDLLLRCRNVCERSMPQSDGLCRSTKPPCILSTFSDPGP